MNEIDHWMQLTDAFGEHYDPRPALDAIARGNADAGYEELWARVHHQGDLGSAAYAAVPELVRLMRGAAHPNWRAYALIATIQECRQTAGSTPVPSWLWTPYVMAMSEVVEPATEHLREADGDLEVRSLLAVLAHAKGEPTIGTFALWTEDERREALDES